MEKRVINSQDKHCQNISYLYIRNPDHLYAEGAATDSTYFRKYYFDFISHQLFQFYFILLFVYIYFTIPNKIYIKIE